jgi:hypothetical protein
MLIQYEGFTCPKEGLSAAQNDDAFAPIEQPKTIGSGFNCAIADGATESLYAGRWANRLVHAFARGRFEETKQARQIKLMQKSWGLCMSKQHLPWYAEAKADSGSFSTLLGLELRASSTNGAIVGSWTATAIGDSCLFLIRREKLEVAFPIDNFSAFNNQPHLLASNPKYNTHFPEWLMKRQGDLLQNDTFYLMTDALSNWLLRETEAGKEPWKTLRDMGTRDAAPFDKWISYLRSEHDFMNDDATMIRVEVESLE